RIPLLVREDLVLDLPAAIYGARQAADEGVDDRADRGEEEHRRDRELDRMRDERDVRIGIDQAHGHAPRGFLRSAHASGSRLTITIPTMMAVRLPRTHGMLPKK